ncbi:MAG: YqiA/YcfP family alpha/beta fold hydrolase [Gammaproteobacteria bacterium]
MIVYLHGFSSGAASTKARFFQTALAPGPVVVPEYPTHRPHAAVAAVMSCIDTTLRQHGGQRLMLIGSSLGGYYAQYLGAHLDAVDRVVLINPALQPQQTLAPYIGRNINMVTGQAFDFSRRDFEALAGYDLAPQVTPAPTLVLLDEGDEIIDYRFATERYRDAGRVIVYPGGSHRFEHLGEGAAQIKAFAGESSG